MTISTNESLRKFILEKENVTIINCIKKVFNSASVDASIVAYKNLLLRHCFLKNITFVAQKLLGVNI